MANNTRVFETPDGFIKRQRLTRSFDTLEDAQRFAEGKDAVDIFRAKGRIVVEWFKTTQFVFDENDNPVRV